MEVAVNGTRLFCLKAGAGAPLVLLHGNGESHAVYDRLQPVLAEHFTVYAVDTRGHGQSAPTAEYRYADMAEDLLAFLEETGLSRPFVFGFSDGGIAALLAAISRPDAIARLAIGGVNLNPRGLVRPFLKELRRRVRAAHDPLAELMLREPNIAPKQLAAVKLPVLVTAGENDLVRRRHTAKLAAALPCAKLCIFPHETHESYVVHSDKLAPVLTQFFTAPRAEIRFDAP